MVRAVLMTVGVTEGFWEVMGGVVTRWAYGDLKACDSGGLMLIRLP